MKKRGELDVTSGLFEQKKREGKVKSESQWNPPNSVESELELQLQFQVWNWNGRSIQFQNLQMELELELMELFQKLSVYICREF